MTLDKNILKKIKDIKFSKYEPTSEFTLWAKPEADNKYGFYVFNNGSWQLLTTGEGGGSGEGDTIIINIPDVSGNISTFTNDSGYITLNDVPSWAKQPNKPSYTANEVGAVPTTRKVNGKALSADITLSANDVGALPSSTVIPAAQVNADWNASSGVAQILNKPSNIIVGSTNSYTIQEISQDNYDDLVDAQTVDSNTIYLITES